MKIGRYLINNPAQEQKIRKALAKKKLKVYREDDNNLYVVWKQSGKFKYGEMRKHYYHRYGINTLITLNEGGTFPWFKNNGLRDTLSEEAQVLLGGNFSDLEDFDINMLDILDD
jgi:hypothetical protein